MIKKSKSEHKDDGKKQYKTGRNNSDLPVEYKSEGIRAAKEANIIELKKDVEVKQGDFKMNANSAIIYFNGETEEVKEVIAEGNVKIYKGAPDTGGVVKARGNKMTFDAEKQIVIIVGNARLWRGDDLMKGRKIIYNMKTGWVNAEKVEGIVQPREKQ